MTVINHASAGDHQGLIKFKNMKTGLYIEEIQKTFLSKKTVKVWINKDTVDHYEVVTSESEASKKGSLAKGLIGGATFGLAGAIAGASSSKTKSKYLVSVVFKDGTKSLCELDGQTYETLVKLLY